VYLILKNRGKIKMIDPSKHDIIYELVEFANMNYIEFQMMLDDRGVDINVDEALEHLENELYS